MKGSRLSRLISLLLCAMLVFSLFPAQAFADDGEGVESEPPASDPVPVYTVSFVDWDGSAIASVLVKQGESATPPSHPEREGYIADGWDKSLSDIQSDLKVTALYKEATDELSLEDMALALMDAPLANTNTVHIYIFVGSGTTNLLQHYTMSSVSDGSIDDYSRLSNINLVRRLQTDTGFALAGKSTFFSNSELYGNGRVQLESTSEPTVYNVYINIKDNLSVNFSVRYLDDAGTALRAQENGSGSVGQTITREAPAISGYTLISNSPQSIKLTFGSNVITFVYSRTYTISYNLGGGTNHPENPTTYTKLSPTITLAEPTRTGYDFVGWSNGGVIPSGSTGNKTFTAYWTLSVYSISYELNGGVNHADNPSTYRWSDSTITLKNPSRAGYTFAGWSPSNNIPYHSTGDKTFTASWTPVAYSIVYNLAGGVNDPANPSTYTVESATITLAAPSREGYHFTGWTPTDSIPSGSTGDKAFTATWSSAIVYNITFDLAGGINDPANPATYTIESDLITLAAPTRAGYSFEGWTPTNNIPAGSTGDKAFTATWSDAIVYDITYELAGGVNDPANPSTYTVESATITLAEPSREGYVFEGWEPTDNIPAGSTGDKTFTAKWSDAIVYDITYELTGGVNNAANPATYTIEDDLITLADPSREGYVFEGWEPTDNIPAGSTGDKAFTATWSDAIVYDITYDLAGGVNNAANPATYTIEDDLITLADPTREGYAFTGWTPTDNIPAGSTGDKSFTATWSAASVYNITYDLAGGVNNPANPATYTIESDLITLSAPTRAGYNFAGWSPTDSIPAGSTGDKTFTAMWSSAIVYNITYTLAGGVNDPTNPTTYTVESGLITLAAPTRTGYNFLGWNPTGTIAAGSTGDKAFTAKWSAAIRYSISYTMNGGINNILNPSSYTVNSATITLRDPVRLGYDFAGWTPTNTIPTGSTGNKVFIAAWTPKVYKIHYDLNGGINNPANPATFTTETPTINLANPTRAGYNFWFWFPLDTIPQGSIGDRYVWAIWSAPINYTITYNLNGGTNNPANPSLYNVNSSLITLADPTREGYTFTGWTPTDSIPAGSTGNKTFTATWSDPIVYNITYDLAGGINDPANPATYTVESDLITLADPTREGYTFTGWTPTGSIPAGSTGNKTFTATWSDPIAYDITYDLAGGINDPANPATYTIESALITLAAPTRAGYDFTGWTPTDNIPAGSTGDKAFTATWSAPIVYPITYVMNGGVNAGVNPATYTVESPTITLAAPAQAGYLFLGWTPAGIIPAGSTGALVFTANWSAPIVYDITYVMNGGINAAANPATYTVESPTITLAAPTREGYDFLGWTPTNSIPAGSVGDVTFTATWSDPRVHTVTYFVSGGTEPGLDGATPYAVYTNVAYGAIVPVPTNPLQDDFTFDGWTTSIPVNMPDADVVIYGSMTRMPALQEIITNERTPLAGPTWSLLNLILAALTALGIGSILTLLIKKRTGKLTGKAKVFSLSSLLPAAGAIVAFLLTQNLSGSMVFADQWTILMAGIAAVQAIVVALSLAGTKKA